jgi:protein tyrosine/serine phosphatase
MLQTTVLLVAVLCTWAALYYGHWVLVRRRFVAISPGRVYQSGAMRPRQLLELTRRYRIATVIDFRGAHEDAVRVEAQALAGTGVRHINIPIATLPGPEELRRFLDLMTEELVAGKRVLMHCKDGEGRAVALAAIYRIEFEGWSAVEAYRAATRLPPGFKVISLLFPRAGLLSPRNCKTQFILNYRASLPGLGERGEVWAGETV